MQKKDVKVGGVYEVKIGRALTEAVVNRIEGDRFMVTDLATHRRHQIKGAVRLRKFLRMNAHDPDAAKKELEVMKPLEEHTPPEVKPKDLEPERNRMRKARRLLEEVKELVQYQDINSRVDSALQRVTKVLFSLDGPNGRRPYVKVDVDPEDVEEHRGNLKDIDTLLKRVGGKNQLLKAARERLGEIDRYLLALITGGKREESEEVVSKSKSSQEEEE